MRIEPIDRSRSKELEGEWDEVAPTVVWKINEYYFGVLESDCLVGYMYFLTNGGVGHLKELIVRKSFRRRKYGRALAEYFLTFCKERGCHKVILDTSEEHVEAIKFYDRLGFHVESKHPNHINNLTWYTYAMFLN